MNKKESAQTKSTKNEEKKSNKKTTLIVLLLIIAVGVGAVLIYIFCIDKTEIVFSDLKSVCEMSTLRCQVHEVAVDTQKKDTFLHLNDKRIWIEFDAWVEYGIDASKVKCSGPDKKGVVTVEMPEAEILAHGFDGVGDEKANSTTGLITKIFNNYTREEKDEIINKAENNILNTIQENEETHEFNLSLAEENAKDLIERYIVNTGKLLGQDLTVKFK